MEKKQQLILLKIFSILLVLSFLFAHPPTVSARTVAELTNAPRRSCISLINEIRTSVTSFTNSVTTSLLATESFLTSTQQTISSSVLGVKDSLAFFPSLFKSARQTLEDFFEDQTVPPKKGSEPKLKLIKQEDVPSQGKKPLVTPTATPTPTPPRVQLTTTFGKIPTISSTYFTNLSGANLTNLNASNISAGTLHSDYFNALLDLGGGGSGDSYLRKDGTWKPIDTANVSGNFTVGGTGESLENSGFALGGNDLFVAGEAGIEGNVYTDGSITRFSFRERPPLIWRTPQPRP